MVSKGQNRKDEIGAIDALKEVASSHDGVAAKFASEAVTVIVGCEDYVDHFAKQMVDGDILLHLNEKELERDIGMSSGLQRKRFIRELESLKIAAHYSAVDESNLDLATHVTKP
ncbi:hypothetical protein KIN20_034578 [Parelaphostrongylus tenuis]|uniref:SAM domain-containing protein n=1 Tax=Parelaphostrongylus tenuis TaxID=148309 RepID=A0AAD5R9V2_PARTN|nr:hypothetical protein KIN20_034578 [Parelaphostrongylus tenuis]